MDDNVLLEMRKITKRFPGVLALDNVDFTLRAGEVHVLIGENGAGKSTLLKILTGAYGVDEGAIFIDGAPVKISGPKDARELGIGIVYQELSVLPLLTVGENIFLGRLPRTRLGFVDWRGLRKQSQQYIDQLKIPVTSRQVVKGMGIAKRQMIEIAKILSMNARIIALDEPTSSLSGPEIERLFELIRLLKARDVGIIYISHRLDELWQIGDRVTVLKDGCRVDTLEDMRQVSKDQLVQMMVGRELGDRMDRARGEKGEEMLRVEDLSSRGKFEHVSFSVRKGEIVGVSGLVGAGRTEVMNAIFGLDRGAIGRIYVRGKAVRLTDPGRAIRCGIGMVSEDRKSRGLVLGMSVAQNITLSNLEAFTRWGVLKSKPENEAVRDLIGRLRIKTPSARQIVMNLSGGNQQKVVIAKWLCARVDIIIMDEPTRGIDIGAKYEIYALMNELLSQGAAIVMISSELPEILGMSDRIYVMHEGRLMGELSREEATEEKIMRLAAGSQTA